MTNHVKLSLSHRNIESLMTLSATVRTGMANAAATFPAPPVTMVTFLTQITALQNAHQDVAATRSRSAYIAQRTAKATVLSSLRQLGEYVDYIANGSDSIIALAGMPSTSSRQPSPAPDMVTNLRASYTGIQGTIELEWDRPDFARMFKVYISTNPVQQDSWTLVDTVQTRRMIAANLTSGTRYYFRVTAVGTNGQSPEGEVATQYAS